MHNTSFFSDIYRSILLWRYWYRISLIDIKNKYSRTKLGPFWITGTVAVTIFAMGPLFGVLFNRPMDTYLLHLATGMVFWLYISTTIGESCHAFIENAALIKNTNKPKYMYVFRIVSRNTIIMLHNISIPIIVALYYGNLSINIFMIIPIICLVVILLSLISYPVGIMSTRYRDFIPLIQNILQLFFFLTPIFWVAGTASERFKFLYLNPFDYILSIMRSPFYGTYDLNNILMLFVFMIIFFIVSSVLYKKYTTKISYWL